MLAHRQFGRASRHFTPDKNMNYLKKSMLLAAGLAAVGLFTWQYVAPKRTARPVAFIGSLDASASNRELLPASLVGMAELAAEMPPGSTTTLFRIDVRCQEIYNGAAPSFTEEFAAQMTPRLKEVAREDNTYLQVLARAVSNRLKTATGPVVIVIDTDWFGEGMKVADHEELVSRVTAWARDSRVACIIACHVNPKRMESARADLAGAGTKAIVTPDEARIETIEQKLSEVSH